MEKFKGTPGPLEPKFISGVCMGVGTPGDYCLMTCNTILPDTDAEYEDEEEVIKANMQLYASAPELLEALQDAIKFINLSVPHERQPKGLERWESAINKALGINQQNK